MNKLLLTIVVLMAVGGGVYVYVLTQGTGSANTQPQLPPYTVPALTREYTNTAYKFALKMPEDFTASEIPADDGGAAIVLQDAHSNGIQIVISPFDEDTGGGYTLTQERIVQDVPDLHMSDVQVLEVGNNYKGLAFKSDNEAFGGASREVWFVFRGNFYQISTYERLDGLLKGIFQTWQFQ